MAARTSASVGIMVTLALFGVLALGLFVFSIILVARVQRLQADLIRAQTDLGAAVQPDEQGDRWEELKRQAGSRQGVVRYLDDSLQKTMTAVSGAPRDTAEALTKRLETAVGAGAPPLLNVLDQRQSEIASLNAAVERANAARDEAQSQLIASSTRLEAVQSEYKATNDRQSAEIASYKAELDRYRGGVEDTKTSMEQRVSTIRSESETTISSLQSQVEKMEADSLILKEQISQLRGERSRDTLKPIDEATLTDGRVVAVNAPSRQVYVDLGRKNRLVIGLVFEVYDVGVTLQPDADGNQPQGKATIEVIRVDETTSLCRILRERKGNPIIEGDQLVNAVYDPAKVYTFTVYGNFDTDGDGVATPLETEKIKALINEWGGKVTEDITGDTDFLVLGSKPFLPPQPRPDDPIELITRYLNLKQSAQKYDDNFRDAAQTGIPVLNQNRLFTLTGLAARAL